MVPRVSKRRSPADTQRLLDMTLQTGKVQSRTDDAIVFAVVASALIFSGFHYIGPLGDQWTLPSFTFRAVAGLLLSGLYVSRGFGIVAWTHALYDIYVLGVMG